MNLVWLEFSDFLSSSVSLFLWIFQSILFYLVVVVVSFATSFSQCVSVLSLHLSHLFYCFSFFHVFLLLFCSFVRCVCNVYMCSPFSCSKYNFSFSFHIRFTIMKIIIGVAYTEMATCRLQ